MKLYETMVFIFCIIELTRTFRQCAVDKENTVWSQVTYFGEEILAKRKYAISVDVQRKLCRQPVQYSSLIDGDFKYTECE